MQHFRLSVKIQQKHIRLMEVQCFNKASNNNNTNNNLELIYSIMKCSKQIVKLDIGVEAKNLWHLGY